MRNWFLLPELRQRTLRYWHIGTGLLLLFFLLQTIRGVLEDVLLPVWGWWAICTLPVLVLLHVTSWLHINPAKIIHPGAGRGFLALVVGYLTLLVLTFFLSKAAVDSNDYDLDRYYQMSLAVLLPLQALILAGCWLLFFKRENVLRPNPAAIKDLAEGKLVEALRQNRPLQAQAYELVAANDLPAAFQVMQAHFGPGHSPLILLQGQFRQWEQAHHLGTLSADESQISLNRIAVAALYMIQEMRA
ncbi:MAG TPA: hypothetical protein PK971_10780 [Saprospiraceae bacterium]|nr:hypothetical protein [Saprospiraceae bacterium]